MIIQQKSEQTIARQIIDIILSNKNGNFTKKEVEEILDNLFILMTKKQKVEICKKVVRCDYYVNAAKRGVDTRTIKGVLKRKESISRQNIDKACEPCEKMLNKTICS